MTRHHRTTPPEPGPGRRTVSPHPSRPVVIGLVGGVASGKSTVARLLEALGCRVVDADRLSHEAMEEPSVKRRVVAEFGAEVLGRDGRIARARLRRVFDDPRALQRLESILHPVVRARTRDRIRSALESHAPGVVVDAPLLLESGLDRLCDVIVMVEANAARRRERARQRGLSPADWGRREKRQIPLPEKRSRAHHILDNTRASPRDLQEQVKRLWQLFFAPPGD